MTIGPLEFTVERNANPASDEVRGQILSDPGFGRFHTDHMVSVLYTGELGWHDARVLPYGPIELDPSAIVLHYAQEVFEGLKAYRWADGSIVSFRPEANAARLRTSSRRLAIPELPESVFIESLTRVEQMSMTGRILYHLGLAHDDTGQLTSLVLVRGVEGLNGLNVAGVAGVRGSLGNR